MEGTFFQDIERNLITEHSITLIKKHLLIGVGIGKDRILIADKMQRDVLTQAAGLYPHNILLEVLLHFGIFIGGWILIYLLKIIYTTIFKNINRDATDVVCIFVSIGFVPLLVSGSYVESPLFYILVGICLYQYNIIRANKKKRDTNRILKGRL